MIGQNLIQHIRRIMERKTCMADSSLCFHFCKELKSSPLLHFFYAFLAHRMKQIKIKIFYPTAFQLHLEILFKICILFHKPYRHFICQKEFFSRISLNQTSSDSFLGFLIVIWKCGIKVVKSTLQISVYHFAESHIINMLGYSICNRQAHTAKP